MRYDIRNRPDYASLHVFLNGGERMLVEPGAMMAHSAGVKLHSELRGGFMEGLKRTLAGESFFMNTFTAESDGQRLDLAPGQPGDILHVRLDGDALLVQSGAFLAATPGVEVAATWGGAKGFFSGGGIVLLRCSGHGDLFLASYGATEQLDVRGRHFVDTSHVIAFDEDMQWRINKVGGIKSLLVGGEGLVVDFEGNGRVFIQSRNAYSFAAFLDGFRPVKKSGN